MTTAWDKECVCVCVHACTSPLFESVGWPGWFDTCSQHECQAAGFRTPANPLARLSRGARGESNGGGKLTTALGNMWRVSERAKTSSQVGGQLFHLAFSKMWRSAGWRGRERNWWRWRWCDDMWRGLLLVVCVSVMNRMLWNRNKLNFKPGVLEEKHLVPPLPLPPPVSTTKRRLNLFTAAVKLNLFLVGALPP